MNVQVCPGCGGRNAPRAESCDWCGRSFSGRQRSFGIRWWPLVGSVLFALVVAGVVALAVLNATRPDARARPTPPSAAAEGPTARPTDAGPPAAPPPRTPTPATRPPTPTAPAPPTATPPPPRYARVVNTGGIGVNLRRDPGPQGQPVTAVPDNALLRLVGPEETVQARLWRLCEHEARGVQGWVPAEYLQPTDQVPTPGRP
jgi:hypothetical protein